MAPPDDLGDLGNRDTGIEHSRNRCVAEIVKPADERRYIFIASLIDPAENVGGSALRAFPSLLRIPNGVCWVDLVGNPGNESKCVLAPIPSIPLLRKDIVLREPIGEALRLGTECNGALSLSGMMRPVPEDVLSFPKPQRGSVEFDATPLEGSEHSESGSCFDCLGHEGE